jgi:hypothetical protein
MKPGILAIWNDVASGGFAHLEKWYTREHIFERVGLPGFLSGRRYELISGGDTRFFTFYEASDPSAFTSPAYLERLNDPTPWTTEAMSHFRNMARTVCEVHASAGVVSGPYAVVLRADGDINPTPAATAFVESLAAQEGVVRAQLWTAASGFTRSDTAEAKLRRGDKLIAGGLVVECVRLDDAERIAESLTPDTVASIGISDPVVLGTYGLLCILDKRALSGGQHHDHT